MPVFGSKSRNIRKPPPEAAYKIFLYHFPAQEIQGFAAKKAKRCAESHMWDVRSCTPAHLCTNWESLSRGIDAKRRAVQRICIVLKKSCKWDGLSEIPVQALWNSPDLPDTVRLPGGAWGWTGYSREAGQLLTGCPRRARAPCRYRCVQTGRSPLAGRPGLPRGLWAEMRPGGWSAARLPAGSNRWGCSLHRRGHTAPSRCAVPGHCLSSRGGSSAPSRRGRSRWYFCWIFD